MKRAVIISVLALLLVPAATAANWPDPKFDQVASQVAGKPVGVWCEDRWLSWIATGLNVFNQDWSFVNGFTISSGTTVYISPRQCETLHAVVSGGPEIVGQYYASSAILTLVHEAMHQRGITNEGEADCAALAALKGVALSYFGYQEFQSETYIASVTRRIKVGKKFVRVTSQVARTRQIPNRTLAAFSAMALAWHKSKPPEYQGNC